MANQNYIDSVAEKIASQVEQLQTEMVRDLLKLSKDRRFRNIDEFLFAMEQINIEQLVLTKAQNILTGYTAAHTQILGDMTLFGEITEETLQAVTNFSTSSFAESIGNMSGVLKNEIIKGVIGESAEAGILQAIQQQAGLSNRQMRTLVTTGLNDYSASVGKIMIDTSPVATKFRYVGAQDDRTRPVCRRLYEAGEMTRDEIKREFGADVFVNRGGYNCRHQWFPVEASEKSKNVR
tara:strand:+ start:3996 stop:4703 length:708 start_codon:yes stop_codon:yes gene_type:complete